MSIGPIGPDGPGEWDDLFARFFGAAEPRRSAQRIDITKYMSNDAREVLSSAARRAAELADHDKQIADLDTDHLLWAVLQLEPLKATVRRAGADHVVLTTDGDWLRDFAHHLRRGEAAVRAGSPSRAAVVARLTASEGTPASPTDHEPEPAA